MGEYTDRRALMGTIQHITTAIRNIATVGVVRSTTTRAHQRHAVAASASARLVHWCSALRSCSARVPDCTVPAQLSLVPFAHSDSGYLSRLCTMHCLHLRWVQVTHQAVL